MDKWSNINQQLVHPLASSAAKKPKLCQHHETLLLLCRRHHGCDSSFCSGPGLPVQWVTLSLERHHG
ncbi:unnamed protein product [Callosobruchus maculatus]|uniref:Uncharacterized protein n=1 Tax=Callosobruchus maculatus TaxID=64391 RepID=A0A653BIK7_CALMS|nr:unnamed protein product [Callosobruchus maculatus]